MRTTVPSSPRSTARSSVNPSIRGSPRPRSESRDGRHRPKSRTSIYTTPSVSVASTS
jgi:hypothetical protein